MEKIQFPGQNDEKIIITEYQKKIDNNKRESVLLQEKIDSYLEELKNNMVLRDEYNSILEKNPNDIETQNNLKEIQTNIDIIHDTMNDLSFKKIEANFDAETYEKVNKKHQKTIAKIPKDSLN